MKETEIKLNRKTELNVKKEIQEEKSLKYFGTLIPHEGHSIWELDNETGEIENAQFITKNWVFNGENKPEVLIRENCEYTSALNKKNAIKNFKSGKLGGKVSIKDPIKISIY